MAKNSLQWITISSEQAMLMSVCLQSIVDELLCQKDDHDFSSLTVNAIHQCSCSPFYQIISNRFTFIVHSNSKSSNKQQSSHIRWSSPTYAAMGKFAIIIRIIESHRPVRMRHCRIPTTICHCTRIEIRFRCAKNSKRKSRRRCCFAMARNRCTMRRSKKSATTIFKEYLRN